MDEHDRQVLAIGATMASLPVVATIRAAYRFLVRDFTTVVRLAWFPLLVLAVVQYFAAEATLDAVVGPGSEDQPIATPYDLVQWVVQIVVFAIVAVSLHRVILFGERRVGQYIAFAFGRSEILFVVLQVLAFLGYVVVGLAFAVAWAGQGPTLSAPPALASLLGLLVLVTALTFILVRFAPLYPIAAAEHRLDFRQAWALTQGKFWRLLLVFLLGVLPLVAVIGVAEGILRAILAQGFGGKPLATEKAVELARGLLIYQVAIFYVITVIACGLGVALLCYSYKALRGLRQEDLLTPEYQVRP